MAGARYDRLLLAYPRWHRRLHGPDMLTALADCAADGRPVSARRFVADGIACRLRVRGAGARLIAACVSAVAAAALAAGLSWIAWQVTVAPWPTVQEGMRIAEPMLPPGMPADETTLRNSTLVTWLSASDRLPIAVLGTPEILEGGVELTYTAQFPEGVDGLTLAEQRAQAAGWQTVRGDPHELTAQRDGMQVRVLNPTGSTIVFIRPTAPAAAYYLGWAGAALGALLGWLAAAAAIARHRRVSRPSGTFAHAVTVFGLCTLAPATVFNLIALAVGKDSLSLAPPWIGYELFAARPGAILGTLCLGLAWLITVMAKGDVEGDGMGDVKGDEVSPA